MSSSGNIGATTSVRGRKERRVTYQLRRCDSATHCNGINRLRSTADGCYLFSASRDSTVKRWEVAQSEGGGSPKFEASFEHHVDWVNDLVLLGDTLVSCSSDKTVNLWQASSPGDCLVSFQQHADYVTCLAAATQRGWVASGGLRGEIFLWDLAAASAVGKAGNNSRPCEMSAQGEDSTYALAFTPSGQVLASGSTNKSVMIWDPRQEGPVMWLKGHQGNIRALAINADGHSLLSAGSDGKIRLWDLGQQRCSQVFGMHSDSVWSLSASSSFSHVYSSGRDGAVFRTCLTTRSSELLLQQDQPILSIAPSPALLEGGPAAGDIWVATTGSDLNRWRVPAAPPVAPATHQFGIGSPPAGSPFQSGRIRRLSMEAAAKPAPLVPHPTQTVKGLPSLVLHTVLNDRRHILTKDSLGKVELWDLTTGLVVHDYGDANFKDVERQLFQPMSVPQWFTTDTKTGCLQVHLETPQCFSAEIYAQDLGMAIAADDLKVNFGEQMLKGLFANWVTTRAKWVAARSRETVEPPLPYLGIEGHFTFSRPEGGKQQLAPAVISEHVSGHPWRRTVTGFDGTEVEGDDIPSWVVECVLHSRLPAQRDMKCAFVLQPAEGSALPAMLQTRLNAPRILRISKVASYTVSKLSEQDINMAVQPPGVQPGSEEAKQAEASGLPVLEITCNKLAVPFEMSLESVRAYLWKRSDDLVLEYAQRGATPARLPKLAPPS